MSNNLEAPRGPNDLFINKGQPSRSEAQSSLETEEKVLPLGDFSEFILKEQPKMLTQIRGGSLGVEALIKRQRELLRSIASEEMNRIINDPDMARFAMLDLSFAMSALTFSGVTPQPEAQQLNAHLAKITGLPEMMTFEKIVSINSRLPFSQMRTFTDGAVGDTEKRFYYGHELMDIKLQDTIHVTSQSVEALRVQREDGVEKVIGLLAKGARNMNEFADFMKAFMGMPREHFGLFRQYLSQYPDGTRNASGAFIGMPRLNIRLVGLSPKYEQFLDEGMQYFKINEQSDIQHAREVAQQGDYLVAQCERLHGNPQQNLARSLIQVVEPIRDFRLSHLAAVQYHVPQALPEGLKKLKTELAQTEEEPILDDESNATKGTGGFLPGPLLRNTLRLDLRALERLNAVINKEK